jgi:hypothetical protein
MNPPNDWSPMFCHPGPAAGPGLEQFLLPLVRRALRKRAGLPALVGWVDRSIAMLRDSRPDDPDRTARGLTRLLCERLQQSMAVGNVVTPDTLRGP